MIRMVVAIFSLPPPDTAFSLEEFVDNSNLLPDNPVKAVTFNKERASNRVIMPDDLLNWWRKIQRCPTHCAAPCMSLDFSLACVPARSCRCGANGYSSVTAPSAFRK